MIDDELPAAAERCGVSESLEELEELDGTGSPVFVSHSAVEAAGDSVAARPGGGILGIWYRGGG
jgi:hypothetical protein